MKDLFAAYLKTYFPESSLENEFGNIEYKSLKRICLYDEILANYDVALQTSIELFEQVFPNADQELFVLVTSWDNDISEIIYKCLEGYTESTCWYEKNELNEEHQKLLVRINKSKIKYQQLIKAIVDSQFPNNPCLNERINFINQQTHQVYFNWDAVLEVGLSPDTTSRVNIL